MTLQLTVRGLCFRRPGIALLCLLASLSLYTNAAAQDVAEAERQQQAQKAQRPAAPRHVYTEDDLKRPRILTPEDQSRVEARKQNAPAATPEQAAAPATSESASETESLGEIARRCRKEKAAREAGITATKKVLPQFRVEVPRTTFAEPNLSTAPLRAPTVASPTIVAPSATPSRRPAAPARVSPFQPRPSSSLPLASVARVNPERPLASPQLQQLRVQRGDSLWRIAGRYLGSGSRWQELLSLNPGLAAHPNSLVAGSTVIVPGVDAKRERGSPSTITVQPGDTFWSLARAHLGRGSDWPRLAHANPQLSDYPHLRVGSQLHLPVP